MDSILSSPPHSQFLPHLPFTVFRPLPNQRIIRKTPRTPILLASINKTPPIRFTSKFTPAEPTKKQYDTVLTEPPSISQSLTKHLVNALFCFAVGVSALGTFPVAPALATATVTSSTSKKKFSEKERVKSDEYSDCTDRVLQTVSGLLRSIEEVRKGNGDMNKVKQALEAVKAKKEESEREILRRLYPELRELREEKAKWVKPEVEIAEQILTAKKEYRKLKEEETRSEEQKARMELLERRMRELEQKYNVVWERVCDVEDEMSRRETVALSFGVLELSFIERECEQLVERFKLEMREKEMQRSH